MKIGWHADIHYNGATVDNTMIRTPLSYLFNTSGCDILILGGDNINLAGNRPRAQLFIENFWNNVDAVGFGEQCYAIPGNHDIPLDAWFRYSDDRALCPRELRYDGISIYLLNTVGSLGYGNNQLTSGAGGKVGVSEMCPYMPFSDIRWLKRCITQAHNRGDIVLIFTHHHVYFTIDSASAYYANKTCLTQLNSYHICRNAHTIYSALQDSSPVIVLMAHLWDTPSGEGYAEYDSDGVYLVYKKHFTASGGADPQTIAYVDANPSTGNVKVYTIEHDYETINEIMNITPSW